MYLRDNRPQKLFKAIKHTKNMGLISEEKLKEAFSRIKEEISLLKGEIKEIKNDLGVIKGEFGEPLNTAKPSKETVSTGNEGVLTNLLTNKLTNLRMQEGKNLRKDRFEEVNDTNKEIINTFQSLAKREFQIFLTIYQLEEEQEFATYEDLEKSLGLNHPCLRMYLSLLLKKKIPIQKAKAQGKTVKLTITPSFRALNLKQRLINLFYGQDSNQTKLSHSF